ncbi:MAG: response regulator [Myxococcales bacterium FL481]|nr:MAG: response regulator [Myxococcales bacterium FL481]
MHTAPAQPVLLLADDDATLRERLATALRHRSVSVLTAGRGEEAMELARAHRPERAVLDLKMPGLSGLQVLRLLLDELPTLRAVVLTGYGSIATAVEAMRIGAVNYLTKPVDADEILAAFDVASDASAEALAAIELETPSLARAEWEHISRVLAECGGNVTQAAKRLRMHRRTLQRKLDKYPPRK